MTFRLDRANYGTDWTCSECSKPITAIAAGGFYNRRQTTCGPECALLRKTRRQALRRAKRAAAAYNAPVANLMPDPDRSESARRRELYLRTSGYRDPAAVSHAEFLKEAAVSTPAAPPKRRKAPKLDKRELRKRLDVRCACGDSGGVIRKRGNLGTFHEGLRGRGHRWRPVR